MADEFEEIQDNPDELIDEQGSGDKPEPAAEKTKDESKDSDREIREELKALRGRVSEAENNAKFWHEKAQAGTKAAKVEQEEEDDTPLSDDVVDALASGDKKRISKLFGEMGFVSKHEVDRTIKQTRDQIAEEAVLYGEYPDLKNKDSEFFQVAAGHYNDLARDPVLAKSGRLIEIAAKMAKLEIERESAAPRKRDSEDGESDRIRRVASQSGDRGRPAARTRENADNAELSPAQANIIAKFQAAGSTLTADGYRKTASKGVRMAGLGRK